MWGPKANLKCSGAPLKKETRSAIVSIFANRLWWNLPSCGLWVYYTSLTCGAHKYDHGLSLGYTHIHTYMYIIRLICTIHTGVRGLDPGALLSPGTPDGVFPVQVSWFREIKSPGDWMGTISLAIPVTVRG